MAQAHIDGADEKYVTYDLEQRTRGGGRAVRPKVKRVHVTGDITGWGAGDHLRKRTGKEVNGVRVEYDQTRRGTGRDGLKAKRGKTESEIEATSERPAYQHFAKIVELPQKAKNAQFYTSLNALPDKYRQAMMNIR
jgi:hypothetical protein